MGFGCIFHALTGAFCPLCGSTRAGLALLHGDPLGAVQCNALLILGLVWLGLWWTARRFPGDGRILAGLSRGFHPAAMGGAAVLFTLVRNLPWSWAMQLRP